MDISIGPFYPPAMGGEGRCDFGKELEGLGGHSLTRALFEFEQANFGGRFWAVFRATGIWWFVRTRSMVDKTII